MMGFVNNHLYSFICMFAHVFVNRAHGSASACRAVAMQRRWARAQARASM
jgi:hypothetical protein